MKSRSNGQKDRHDRQTRGYCRSHPMAIKAPSRPAPSPPPRPSQPLPSLSLQEFEKEELRLRNELRYTADFFRAGLFANWGHKFQKLFRQLLSNQPPCEVKEFKGDDTQSTEELRRSTIQIQRMLSEFGKRVCAFQQELNRHQSQASGMEPIGHGRQRKFETASVSHCFVLPEKVKSAPRQKEIKVENATRTEVSEKQDLRGQRKESQRGSSKNAWIQSQQEQDQANERNLQGTANHTSRYSNTESTSKRRRGQRAGRAVQRRHAPVKLLELFETMVGPKRWTWLYQGKRSSSQMAACPPCNTWGQAVQPRGCEDTNDPFS